MSLPAFKIEEYFMRYEFTVPYMLGSSDAETHTLGELIAMADAECLALWNNLKLTYTEYTGLPLLREELSRLYSTQTKDNMVVFSGAEEAIYITMKVLLERGDHVVVLTPCYESLKVLPKVATGNVTEFPLQWRDNTWVFDLEKFQQVVTDKTKLVIVNFPHNPTGFQPSREEFAAIVAIVKQHNAYLFCDEVYRLSEQNPQDCLPNAVDCYEKALSIGVMSKSFGLAGVRIGWMASHDTQLLKRLTAYKNYTSMCNSAPSEILSLIALRNQTKILQRNVNIARDNLALLDKFFAQYSDVFQWYRPKAGFISFPRLNLNVNVDEFAERMAQEQGALILPGSLFDDNNNRFRLGFGRINLPEAIVQFEQFLRGYL